MKKTVVWKTWWACIVAMLFLCLPVVVYAAENQISEVTIKLEPQDNELPKVTVSTGCTLDDASWMSSKLQPGAKNEVKVTVKPASGYTLAYKPAIKVEGGEYKSTSSSNSKKLVMIVKSDPLYITFPKPEDVEWDGAKATWEAIDSDYKNFKYEVSYNGKTYQTTQNYYDLSDKAKKSKKYFKVRVIPKDSKTEEYSSSSEWVESDELDWDDVNNGWHTGNTPSNRPGNSNRPNSSNRYWEQRNGYWYFWDGGWVSEEWVTWNGNKYYLRGDGTMATGEEEIDGKRYFFSPSGSTIKEGWAYSNWDQCWYFINGSYDFATGKRNINGQNYYFYNNGEMATGWQEIDGNTYYFGTDGAMRVSRWEFLNGRWYYFDNNGIIVRNCWREISGKWYCFYEDGTMACNTWIGNYHVNQNGEWDNY